MAGTGSGPVVGAGTRPYRLFVSYSHRNEAQRDRLVNALAPLCRNGLIGELWHDRAIDAGDDWLEEIREAMARADGAIFLLCENFCASAFCLDQEIPPFLQRHRDEGAVVLFVLGNYCGWDEYDFIKQFQLIPRDNRPVVSYRPHAKAYTMVQKEIKQALLDHRAEHASSFAEDADRTRPGPLPGSGKGRSTFGRILDLGKKLPGADRLAAKLPGAVLRMLGLERAILSIPVGAVGSPASGLPVSPAESEVPDTAARTELDRLLAKLPGQTARLFGREEELARLDAWHGHKGVLLWVADGGYGKSALVRWWLEHHLFAPGTRFLGQSFYSQGSHSQATTARPFLLQALAEWGIDHAVDAPDGELGRLLAEAAAKAPSLIVLDGMESLQQAAPGDPRLNGVLRDQGLAALLAGLAENPGQAACLATSRLTLPDSAIPPGSFRQWKLHELHPADAQALLEQRGVKGGPDQLVQMAKRCGHHPLTLVLAAEFCHSFLDDSIAAFLARDWPVAAGGAHSATVMAWFDAELVAERQDLDRDLARVLGLFDRPAPWAALLALKEREPPIPGLTEALHDADDDELLESLARLRQWGLLHADLSRPEPDLDAHPLVREHFGAQLEKENPEAYRAAHSLLFEWFRNLPAQHQPDTLEELEPLYRAMGHGCKVGAFRTALDKIYLDRIRRGQQGYTLFQLGAYSSDLAALAGFFPDGWATLPVTGEGDEALGEAARSWLLAAAAFCLMSLGRLEEALGPRRRHRQRSQAAENWIEFCIASNNLVEVLALLGRWVEAGAVADESLAAARRIVDPEIGRERTMLAHAHRGQVLCGLGRLEEAAAAFEQAEAVQVTNDSECPRLYGRRGFGYAQLMLERAARPEQWRDMLERGRYALKIDSRDSHLLSLALDHGTIGQSLSVLGESVEAGAELDRAVAIMQRAGKIQYLPIMHLARARHRHGQGDLAGAWADHDAALRTAEAGGMRAYLADAALLAGQLCLDQGQVPDAAAQHARAAEIIHADGYGRRLAELHLLDARLRHHQHDPEAARAALAAAEVRIREIGQWGLWRDLVKTAAELGADLPEECPVPREES